MFSELSKVFFHVILKKNKITERLNLLKANNDISYSNEPQEVTAQRLGRKIVHMKNSSKKNTPKSRENKHLFLPNHRSKTYLNTF